MMQEHCSEEIIIHKLKQYISEFKDSIYKCEEQLEIYTCHLHSLIQISHFGDLVIDLEVQALKTGVTIVKQFNYFWPKSLFEELWKETHVMADLVQATNCPKCENLVSITEHLTIQTASPDMNMLLVEPGQEQERAFKPLRNECRVSPVCSKLSLTSYADLLKNNYKKLLRRDNIDIQVCKLFGAFPAEPDIEHLENIQRHISFNCCL